MTEEESNKLLLKKDRKRVIYDGYVKYTQPWSKV